MIPLVKYKVMEKGQNERARFAKLLSYQGPDEVTIQLLHSQKLAWLQNPASFWIRSNPHSTTGMKQQAQIVSIYLEAESVDA